jgi:hypothetical protein
VAVRLETELARRGSEGGGGVLVTRVQEGEGELVRELRRGDVVLMVLLAKEEKGWNFGSTRIRTAAESGVASARSGLRAREEEEERVRKG